MMEAQCAAAETAIRGAEPGLAKVKNYFTCLKMKRSKHNHREARRCSFTLVLKQFIFSISPDQYLIPNHIICT